MTKKVILFIIFVLLLASCSSSGTEKDVSSDDAPAEEISTATIIPTETPEPTPTPKPSVASPWLGEWKIWAGDFATYRGKIIEFTKTEEEYQPKWADYKQDGEQLIAAMTTDGEEEVTFVVWLSEKGISADGIWEIDEERHGRIGFYIQKDGVHFTGHMDGIQDFCGVRPGPSVEKASPCFMPFNTNLWDGEWYIWMGPDEVEAVIALDMVDGNVEAVGYGFKGEVMEDQTIEGTWQAFGLSGTFKAQLVEGKAQFMGNMNGLFPFCGTKPKGPKPDPCMISLE